MKKFLFIVFVAIFVQPTFSQKVLTVEYANEADIKVFVVNYLSQADLKVYKEDFLSQAVGNNGLWYFAKIRSEADVKILFVDYPNQADLKIYFVKYKNQAGWMTKEKKYLLETRKFRNH